MDPKQPKPATYTIPKEDNKLDGAKTLILVRDRAVGVDALYWAYVPFANDDPQAESNLRAYFSNNPKLTSPARFRENLVDLFAYTDEKDEGKKVRYKRLTDVNNDVVPYVPGQSFVFLDKKVRINLPAKRDSNGVADFGGLYPNDIHFAVSGCDELTVSGLDVANVNGKVLANRITLEDVNEGKVKLLIGNVDAGKGSAHHLFGIGSIDTLSTDDSRVSRLAGGTNKTLTLFGNCHIDACRFKLPADKPKNVPRGTPAPKNPEKQGPDRELVGYSLNVGGVATNNHGPTVPLVTFSNRCNEFVILPVGGSDESVAQIKLKGLDTNLDDVRKTYADAQAKVLLDFAKNRKVSPQNPAVGAIVLDTGKAPMHSELALLLAEDKDATKDVKTLAQQLLKIEFQKDKKSFAVAPAELSADLLKAVTKANPTLKTQTFKDACAAAFRECNCEQAKLEAALATALCKKDAKGDNLCGFANDDAAKQVVADVAKALIQKPVPAESPKKEAPMGKLPPVDIERFGALPRRVLELGAAFDVAAQVGRDHLSDALSSTLRLSSAVEQLTQTLRGWW